MNILFNELFFQLEKYYYLRVLYIFLIVLITKEHLTQQKNTNKIKL
jgi:hypothetical protein